MNIVVSALYLIMSAKVILHIVRIVKNLNVPKADTFKFFPEEVTLDKLIKRISVC